MYIFLFLIPVAVFVVWGAERWTKHRSFGRRPLLAPDDLCELFGTTDQSFLMRILQTVGRCYGLDGHQLRPQDTFDGNLNRLDSWHLGASSEDLEAALFRDLHLEFPPSTQIKTLQELVDLCARVQLSQGS